MKVEIICDELDFLEQGFKKKNPDINDQVKLEQNTTAVITNKTTMRGGILPQFLVEFVISADLHSISSAVSNVTVSVITGLISSWLYDLLKQVKHKKTRLLIDGKSVEVDENVIKQRVAEIIEKE
jgi:hypothetical protein